MKVKEEIADMKPVVDLMGATKKVLNNMVNYFEQARDEANEKQIKPEKYWSFIMNAIKTEAKISAEHLLNAGLPTPILMECILDEVETQPQALTYKNLILTMKDKSTKKIPVDQVLSKVQPFTKNFKSPMEAIILGDSEAILKVFQHIYGNDVLQWSIPAEESIEMPQLQAVCLVEFYNLMKFETESKIFELKDDKVVIKEEVEKGLYDAFEKKDKAYLLNLFPNVCQCYPQELIQESQTVLNLLSKEQIDKLFPHIQSEYLVNLREDQKKELVTRLEGFLKPQEVTKSGGKMTMAVKPKAKKKVAEGVSKSDGGSISSPVRYSNLASRISQWIGGDLNLSGQDLVHLVWAFGMDQDLFDDFTDVVEYVRVNGVKQHEEDEDPEGIPEPRSTDSFEPNEEGD